MIILLIVAFLLGAYANAFLARRKYNEKIRELSKIDYLERQGHYSRGYATGYETGKAHEAARQENVINDIFMKHTYN